MKQVSKTLTPEEATYMSTRDGETLIELICRGFTLPFCSTVVDRLELITYFGFSKEAIIRSVDRSVAL